MLRAFETVLSREGWNVHDLTLEFAVFASPTRSASLAVAGKVIFSGC